MHPRLLATEAELESLGEELSITFAKRLTTAYQIEGNQGLVGQRLIRLGVRQRVPAYWDDEVPFPPQAAFHRLVGKLAQGRHASASARTRRRLSQQPLMPSAGFARSDRRTDGDRFHCPDIAVEFEDGFIGLAELAAIVDVATCNLFAAILKLGTKVADAALLLAAVSPGKSCGTDGRKPSPWPPARGTAKPGDRSMSSRRMLQRKPSLFAKVSLPGLLGRWR